MGSRAVRTGHARFVIASFDKKKSLYKLSMSLCFRSENLLRNVCKTYVSKTFVRRIPYFELLIWNFFIGVIENKYIFFCHSSNIYARVFIDNFQ